MSQESGSSNEKKSNLQNLWDKTLKTVQDTVKNAVQPVTCFFQATQKKVELMLLTRTITAAQNGLGKAVDTAREAGLSGVFENPEVKSSMENLDQLKQNAAKLTAEIEALQKPCACNSDEPKE